MTTTQTIRIGIIGSGGIARAHVNAYKTIDNVEIVAVADLVPGKAREFIEANGLTAAQPFEDHRELLQLDLDGVSICTPNMAHHRTSVDAMKAGKQVLLEKPMSVTLDEAIEMVQVSKQTGNMLTIGFQPRYDPNMHIVRSIVQSGQLGNVYYVETGGGRRRGMPRGTFVRKELAGAGAMADIGCYSLDMALHALGYPKPLSVSAYTSNFFGTNPKYHPEADRFDVEDFGVALIRLEGGIALNFKISWAMHMDTLGATMFLGSEGGLKITPAGKGPWSGVWDGKVGSMTLFHDVLGHHTESPIPVKEHSLNLFQEKVKDFVAAIREGRSAPIPGEEILYNQAIIDGVLRSSELRREVEISLPNL
ncbi:Gfo/Idh/MocA family protein [Paenibacillus ginsengarvi]|uniref:Gfo/Idh/MocA family oxidoreductase n=1 Tax=Paenibacillus ginsengarvi TaxID=400777 RepID=A0A3B0CY28_9BACL|nr:Gfo/Idh/MocA family oxidoreductase [Paenibacillus ginsengarvi]RKN86646.1 gfo/Idh/MocA family oxidoreductase [Paenibacillus ginsengarvi]